MNYLYFVGNTIVLLVWFCATWSLIRDNERLLRDIKRRLEKLEEKLDE